MQRFYLSLCTLLYISLQLHDLFRNAVYDTLHTVGQFLLFSTALPPSSFYSYLLQLATNYIQPPRPPLQPSNFHNSGLYKNEFFVSVSLHCQNVTFGEQMPHVLNHVSKRKRRCNKISEILNELYHTKTLLAFK